MQSIVGPSAANAARGASSRVAKISVGISRSWYLVGTAARSGRNARRMMMASTADRY